MRELEEYYLPVQALSVPHLAEFAFMKVFRTGFNQPGFAVLDFGKDFSSEKLRRFMVELKEDLSDKLEGKFGLRLNYQWMGRFDQQETTKFHRDNAADQSFLMLGYEPTKVKSKLFLADFAQFSTSIGISEEEYFDRYNPMFMEGEQFLKPYITEIKDFDESSYKIVLLNNSISSHNKGTIGVLHKAAIIEKLPDEERVINSTMIFSSDINEPDSFSKEQQQAFITTREISIR